MLILTTLVITPNLTFIFINSVSTIIAIESSMTIKFNYLTLMMNKSEILL